MASAQSNRVTSRNMTVTGDVCADVVRYGRGFSKRAPKSNKAWKRFGQRRAIKVTTRKAHYQGGGVWA